MSDDESVAGLPVAPAPPPLVEDVPFTGKGKRRIDADDSTTVGVASEDQGEVEAPQGVDDDIITDNNIFHIQKNKNKKQNLKQIFENLSKNDVSLSIPCILFLAV